MQANIHPSGTNGFTAIISFYFYTRIWSSLLFACEIHDRRDVAHEIIASELMKSEPDNPANYVLLSKIHAESGNCYGAEEVRRVMQRRGLKKSYGFSKVES